MDSVPSKRDTARRVLAAIDPADVAAELLTQTRHPAARQRTWEKLMDWNEPDDEPEDEGFPRIQWMEDTARARERAEREKAAEAEAREGDEPEE